MCLSNPGCVRISKAVHSWGLLLPEATGHLSSLFRLPGDHRFNYWSWSMAGAWVLQALKVRSHMCHESHAGDASSASRELMVAGHNPRTAGQQTGAQCGSG